MITTVTYARLYNLGNYENERIEVTVQVENGDLIAAHQEAVAAVQQAYDDLIAARRRPAISRLPEPAVLPAPATQKQRSYIATLQDELGWYSEQMAQYAKEQGIDLVAMTSAEASKLINQMKQIASENPPF